MASTKLVTVFDGPPLRPADPFDRAQMRIWTKYVDEVFRPSLSFLAWHRVIPALANALPSGEFEKRLERIPLQEQREKWRTARSGFSEADLANATRKINVAVDKVEAQLGETFTLADVNFFSHCGMMLARMFPEIGTQERCPRLLDWAERMRARPGVAAALVMPDRTNPALRTFTGHVQ